MTLVTARAVGGDLRGGAGADEFVRISAAVGDGPLGAPRGPMRGVEGVEAARPEPEGAPVR
ncbi:hypothetical protein [Streptosporangium lutulentum]|uniref:Uncharacterized protein n=1 Tax=Streptosporangium lutulentum TaxID=1461250 RepID=A0ABT9QJW0_9ACTN|nr:hypothetical protein [Streptosporangium lutulentum]MDP9847047.1 hypothetical protein [Streptosporangium lutulentum]